MADMNVNTTQTAELSAENKVFYQKVLIQTAEAELIHDQFGQKRPIPKNNGKTTEFRQFDPLPEVTQPLTEGVTPDGQSLSVKTVIATVRPYGGYVTVSDELEMTAIDPVIVEATKLIASQGGRSMDTVTREIINGGTNVYYGGGKASRADIGYTSEADNCNLTGALVRKIVRTLEAQNAPKIDGYYVAIVDPYVKFDLQSDKEWREPNIYGGTVERLFKGEIGELGGVRFVENSRAKVFAGEGKDGQDVHSTLFIGSDAYGVVDIDGEGMEHIVKPKGSAGSADPLNQRATIGWKCPGKTAAILVDQYMVRCETSATP